MGAIGGPSVGCATGALGKPPAGGATGALGEPPVDGAMGALGDPPVGGATGALGKPPEGATTGGAAGVGAGTPAAAHWLLAFQSTSASTTVSITTGCAFPALTIRSAGASKEFFERPSSTLTLI